jgi:apolipoprotein N-acyltransferase
LNSQADGWRANLLAIAAGALVTPSLAPFDLWPLAIISLALLAWLLADGNSKTGAKRGWYYGLGLFGCGSSWVYVSIHVYGYAPVPLAIFLTLLFSAGLALFCSLSCWAYVRWLRDHPQGQWLGFAAVFALGEWLRSWLLTGFPWLYVGYSHIDSPLAGWAPVVGIYGLGFILALTAAVISLAIRKRALPIKPMLLIALLWLSGFGLKTVDWVEPSSSSEPVRVAMVQANIPQQIKWRRDQYLPTLELYRSSSEKLWAEHDIVIWPEAAVPAYYQQASGFLAEVSARAELHNTSLITGIPFAEVNSNGAIRKRYNSIMGFANGSGTYFKQRLVPFGEYVPLQQYLNGLLEFFELPLSNFSAGSADQAGIKAGDLTLAPFICYEIVYPGLVSQWLPEADLLITISNDAWFGRSIGPLQHLQMAQMRALESGRYLLRSTGSGVSAIIDQRGQIVTRGDQFSREVISGEAKIYSGSTPFALTGSWPILLLCSLICISLPLITVKMRR